jgi:hypothetical protein
VHREEHRQRPASKRRCLDEHDRLENDSSVDQQRRLRVGPGGHARGEGVSLDVGVHRAAVDVSDSHAIARIALGAESLLSYMGDKSVTLEEDCAAVKKLAAIAKHFETLRKSGQ